MSILVNAVDTFYSTKNEAVFSASKTENIKRNVADFNTDNNTKNSVYFFSDDKEISLNLSNESMELLTNHFSANDFLKLSNGNIGLSGKAAAFVEGWYKDIMINRNFLNADRDKNGRIENNEHLSLKNSVEDVAKNQDLSKNFGAVVLRMTQSTTGYVENTISDKSLSIEALIDESIKSDRNFDGIITRLEYSAKGGTDMQGYTNWAIDALNDILDDSDKAKIHLVVDPTSKIWHSYAGKTLNEVKAYYDNPFRATSGTSASGFLNIVIEEPRILPSNDLENEKEQLLNEFPEFRALIQNNPNITKEKLLKLKNQQRITHNYQDHQKQDLQKEFTQNFFKTDLKA